MEGVLGSLLRIHWKFKTPPPSYILLPISRGPAPSLGAPGSQVKNTVEVVTLIFIHMGSVTVFKGPLLEMERLVYLHHCTDRETEAQAWDLTWPPTRRVRGAAGVKQVRVSTQFRAPSAVPLSKDQFQGRPRWFCVSTPRNEGQSHPFLLAL